MRQRRRVMVTVADYHQATDVVRCRFDGEFATADDVGVALLADPALERLHVSEAGKALIGGARGPLAVGLHQGSHEFLNSFQVRRGGLPSPEASAPTRFCVQG